MDLHIDLSALKTALPAVASALSSVDRRVDPEMLNSQILSQDVIEYTRLERTPIIAASLLAPALYQSMKQRDELNSALSKIEQGRTIPLIGPMCEKFKKASRRRRTLTLKTVTIPANDSSLRLNQVAEQIQLQ